MDKLDLLNGSITSFTEHLASPDPVPGGGGACALVGAVGIALGNMVGGHTIGHTKDAEKEACIRTLMDRAEALRIQLLASIEKDARAFEPLSRAYSIPKDTPDRDVILEKCLHDAAEAPLEMVDLICEAIEVLKEFSEKGRKLILSDAATGISFCRAALYGAAVNVKVNTHLMKDRDYAARLDEHVDRALESHSRLADQAFENVYQRYC